MVIHGDIFVVHDIELGEDILVEAQIASFLEDLRYVLLVVQMVRLMSNMGKLHWGYYLVQIVELRESPLLGCYMVDMREAPLLSLHV